MLSNQGFVSSLLTDEMYERENFDFQQLFTQISQRVDTADRWFEAVEKELRKDPPHKVHQIMTNLICPMLRKINSLKPVNALDDVI